MAQSDDIARLVAWQVSQVQGGAAALMRQRTGQPASHVAKACGITPDLLYMWETGLAQPTTGQALAWFDFLRLHAPNPRVAAARSQAEQAERRRAEQAEQAKRDAAVAAAW